MQLILDEPHSCIISAKQLDCHHIRTQNASAYGQTQNIEQINLKIYLQFALRPAHWRIITIIGKGNKTHWRGFWATPLTVPIAPQPCEATFNINTGHIIMLAPRAT